MKWGYIWPFYYFNKKFRLPIEKCKTGYHGQDVINQTDILTWTSKRGHTNEITPHGQGVAQAGARHDPQVFGIIFAHKNFSKIFEKFQKL